MKHASAPYTYTGRRDKADTLTLNLYIFLPVDKIIRPLV